MKKFLLCIVATIAFSPNNVSAIEWSDSTYGWKEICALGACGLITCGTIFTALWKRARRKTLSIDEFRLPYYDKSGNFVPYLNITKDRDPIYLPEKQEFVEWPQYEDFIVGTEGNSYMRREFVGNISFTRRYLNRVIIPMQSFSQLGNTCGLCTLFGAAQLVLNQDLLDIESFKSFLDQAQKTLLKHPEKAIPIKNNSMFMYEDDLEWLIKTCDACKPLRRIYGIKKYDSNAKKYVYNYLEDDISIIGLEQLENIFERPLENSEILNSGINHIDHAINNIERFRSRKSDRQIIMVNINGNHWILVVMEYDEKNDEDIVYFADSLGVDRKGIIDRIYRIFRTDPIPGR